MVIKIIIFDSGFLFAFINKNDSKHNLVVPVMEQALKGIYGRMIVTNYIIDEAMTLSRFRTHNCEVGLSLLSFLKKKKNGMELFYEVIIDKDLIKLTEKYYHRFCTKGLSFTDCSLLSVIEVYEINYLATLDKGFKGIVPILP